MTDYGTKGRLEGCDIAGNAEGVQVIECAAPLLSACKCVGIFVTDLHRQGEQRIFFLSSFLASFVPWGVPCGLFSACKCVGTSPGCSDDANYISFFLFRP